jgi:hypothetical protein
MWARGPYSAMACHRLFMGLLFLVELSSFMSSTTQSTIVVDFNTDKQASVPLPPHGCV